MIKFLFNKKKSSKLSVDFETFLNTKLGIKPLNEDLYLEAITHSSYKNIQNQSFDNERLEFLGDAFISLIVAKYLFKLYPKKQEGYLTQLRAKIVSRDHLNKLGSSIGLEEFILYQKSANSYKSLVGNAFEALYGAIFLDLGFERAQISFEKFILIPHLDIDKIILENRDYKSELLIFFQKKEIKISFQTLKDEECNDGLQFMCNIIANGKKIGLGKGSSKKIAEQRASKNALSEI
tara:strand:+ start:158 stop:865 length:708 start_codon:yes stop_codon:yes gene_type:complete